MGGRALEASSVDSPFDTFHGEVKEEKYRMCEGGRVGRRFWGYLGCLFV